MCSVSPANKVLLKIFTWHFFFQIGDRNSPSAPSRLQVSFLLVSLVTSLAIKQENKAFSLQKDCFEYIVRDGSEGSIYSSSHMRWFWGSNNGEANAGNGDVDVGE